MLKSILFASSLLFAANALAGNLKVPFEGAWTQGNQTFTFEAPTEEDCWNSCVLSGHVRLGDGAVGRYIWRFSPSNDLRGTLFIDHAASRRGQVDVQMLDNNSMRWSIKGVIDIVVTRKYVARRATGFR